MSSKADILKADALEHGDPSQLSTKNINGQMFLVLASELEIIELDDSSTDTEPESDIEIDCEPFDPGTSITLGLLDENGQEKEEIFVKGNRPCSTTSFETIWKNRIFKSFYNKCGRISSADLPSFKNLADEVKWFPQQNVSSSPRNTYIIKTSLPLSSLNLKSLIYSASSISGLVSNNQTGKTIKLPETFTISKTISPARTPVSSYPKTPVCSSSTPSFSLLSQKTLTATTNSITSPISCVNKTISPLPNTFLFQSPSLSLNANNSVITSSTYTDNKLVQAVANPTITTAANPLVQSFPIASTNVIKPLKPVLDTGQLIPKVEIPNTNLLGSLITSVSSQGLTSNVQSKPLSSSQIGQLVNISLANNSNSLPMAPCLLFSTTGTGTSSSTPSTMKAPIVHSGFVPQNLISSIKQEPNQTSLINNVTSSTLSLTSTTSTLLAPMNNTATVQKMLRPNTTLTSSIGKPIVSVNKIDSNSSGTGVSTVAPASTVLSLASTPVSPSSSSSCTFVSIPDPNSSSGSLLVKILPKSTPPAIEDTLTLPSDFSSVEQAKNYTICPPSLSENSDQDVTLSELNNAKRKLKQNQVYHNITINSSLPATTLNDSPTNLAESKTSLSVNNSAKVNNMKTIELMTPFGACSIFSPTVTSSDPITTISNTHSSNENTNVNLQKDDPVIKICGSNNMQQNSVIVLLKPLLSSSDTVSPMATTSAGIDTPPPPPSQKDEEETNSVKIDDTVQFLKLGSLANNESNTVKVDAANNGAKIVNGLVEMKTNDDPSVLKLPTILMKDTDSKSVQLNLIPDNDHQFKLQSNSSNNTADVAKLNQTSSVLNLNTKVNNTNLIKIPGSLINGRHVITLPAPAQGPSSAPGVTLPNLISSSNAQFLSLTSKPTTGAQILNSQLSAGSQLVTLSSQAQKGTQLVTLPNQAPTTTQLVTLSSQVQKGTQLVTLPNQTPTTTQLVTLSSQTQKGTQLVTLPNQTPTTTQLVTLSSQAQNGTQLVKLTSQLPAGSQLVSLLSQAQTSAQLVKLTNQLPSGTHLATLPTQIPKGAQLFKLTTQLPPGTQLSSRPTQLPKGAQLVKLTTQLPPGTQLPTLPSQAPTGTQFVTFTSQAQRGTQQVNLTTQTVSSPRVVTPTSQVPTGTQLVPLTNQATTRTQLVPLTTQAPSGQPIGTMSGQATETAQRVSLVNQGTANTQFVTLTNPNRSGAHVVKLSNQALGGAQLLKLPNQINPGIKLPAQTLPVTSVTRLNMVNSTSPHYKLMPITSSPRMQLSQPAKLSAEPVSKSESTNNNGQMLTMKSTNMSNANRAVSAMNADVLQKLQTGESCAVVLNRKAQVSSHSQTSTATTASVCKAVSMHSLLAPKEATQKVSSTSVLESPQKSPKKLAETQTKIEAAEDLPMTLKIDSIFSLKDEENKGFDYWENTYKPIKTNQVVTGCGNKFELTSPGSSCKYEREDKVVLNKNIQSETEQVDVKVITSPQSKTIVYARLNKPRPPVKVSPTQVKHYKIHDLSNHFPIVQRKKMLNIGGRPFKTRKTVSVIKQAKRSKIYKIKGRLHINIVKQKRYAFLQPRVILPQLYIPARMKSVFVSKLPPETINSLTCESECIHRVRISYPAPRPTPSSSTAILNGNVTPQAGQHFMLVKVDGRNVIKPCYPNLGSQTQYVLKDSNAMSSLPPGTFFRKQGGTILKYVPSTAVRKIPVSIAPFRNIAPAVQRNKSVYYVNKPSLNKDDALSSLQLACGILQDNTLKRKSSSSADWRGEDNNDSDWSEALEMPSMTSHKSKRRKTNPEEDSSSDPMELV